MRDYLLTIDPFLDIAPITGATGSPTLSDVVCMTRMVEDDAAHHLGDAPEGTAATVNTVPTADPSLWVLTLHYPDGTHQSDTYQWADEPTPTGGNPA